VAIQSGKSRYFLCIGLSLVLSAAIGDASNTTPMVPERYSMTEPLVGIEYDVRAVKYEEIPLSLYAAMGLRDGPWWYYGKYDDSKVSGKQYFMIAGLLHPWLDTEPPKRDMKVLEESDEVMVLHEGKYEDVDNVIGYSDPVNGVPERAVAGLSQDAAARMVKAFGSPEAVDRAIAAQADPRRGMATINPKEVVDALKALGVTKVCLADMDHGDYFRPGCVKQP